MLAYLQAASNLLVLMFVMSTMLGVGLLLTVRQLSEPLRDLRRIAPALLANFVLIPCAALGVATLLELDTPLRVALLLLGTAPGGPVLIKLTAIAKADQAVAVSLVVMLMLISIVYQPLVLPLLILGVKVSSAEIIRTLVISVLIPLLLGLLLRARWEPLANRLRPGLDMLSGICILLIVFVLPALHYDELAEFTRNGGILAALAFLSLAIAAGWCCGWGQTAYRRVLVMCCGQGNMAAAFVVATHNFSDPKVVVMLLVIMLVSVMLLLPMALVFGRRPV